MHRRDFFATSAALAASPLLAKTTPPHSRRQVDLDELRDVTKTPGIAAKGVVRGEPVLLLSGVEADAIFSAGSLTKPVFAMAVRWLVREGKLDWRKPLQEYVPLGLTGDAATITAEHVVTHATGLVNWRFDSKQPLETTFKPGTRWEYSGEGYVLLQRVVEKIAGQPLGRYFDETVLPKLGMSNSTFSWSPALSAKSVAFHDNRGEALLKSGAFYAKAAFDAAQKAGSTPDKMTYDEMMEALRKFSTPLPIVMMPNAAGSLWTTIGDYAKFLDASTRDFAAHQDEYAPRNRVNRDISWALSWGADASVTPYGLFHWGDGAGLKNFAWWQPAEHTALVIFTTSDHGASAYRYLLRQTLGADPLSPEWI